ncbi:MAG TPA: S8/S53 family peptidase [Actinomycetota bacterium]|nr:S8/S53 family peptidase [Actinomycetota bacterium]
MGNRCRSAPAVFAVLLLVGACTKPGTAGSLPPFSAPPSGALRSPARPNDLCPRPECAEGPYSGFSIDDAWVDAIGLPEAWRITHGGGVTVVLLDAGVSDLADMQGKVLERIAGRGVKPTLNPEQAVHGNAMASIIAADTDNGVGIAGVGWDTQIVSIDMGEAYTHFTELRQERRWDRRHIVDLFRQAAQVPGVRIISFSSVVNPSASLEREIERIVDAGVLVVAGAGNEESTGVTRLRYPAAYDGVIGVGGAIVARDGSVGIWAGSNVGSQVDVYSPTYIPALIGPGNVDVIAGTSPATALTSGVLALLLSEYPELTPPEIEELFATTSSPIPSVYRTRDPESGDVVTVPGEGPMEPHLIDAAALFAGAAAMAGG